MLLDGFHAVQVVSRGIGLPARLEHTADTGDAAVSIDDEQPVAITDSFEELPTGCDSQREW
jgi:hypothetical protein